MKTAQIMKREFLGGIVRQNHKTGMFSVVDLEVMGNAVRKEMGLADKQATHYFKTTPAKEHVNQVSIETGTPERELIIKKPGRGGGTWVHPLIFLDIAMWFNPRFKVKVLNWLMDNLLLHRDCSGNSFKEMNTALTEAYPDAMAMPYTYPKVANEIARACGIVSHGKDRWNSASETILNLRNSIQKNIIFAAKMCPDLGSAIRLAITETVAQQPDPLA